MEDNKLWLPEPAVDDRTYSGLERYFFVARRCWLARLEETMMEVCHCRCRVA
jgi:hypothetical protein